MLCVGTIGIVSSIKRSIPDLRSMRHQHLENSNGKIIGMSIKTILTLKKIF